MKRVLVAGATGYLGGFVCQELKARGHFVRALARSPEKLDRLKDSLDEIVEAEVTRPETLEHVCDWIDVVFSSIGITRQKDKLSFQDVDYQGNRNLLEVAQRAGVERFVYVSVFNGPSLRHLDIVRAHEDFVDALKASGIDYAVLRPTGYFSDMGQFLEMAKKGRVYVIGSGKNRVNPIHGADLAVRCVDAIDSVSGEIDMGGPETVTWEGVATLAFEALGRPARVTHVPEWLMWLVVRLVRIFNRHQGELLAFFTTMATTDVVAPLTGTRTLEGHFERCRAMKVEDLSQYGKPLGLPKEAQRKQVGIVFSALREKVGLPGMVPFFISLFAEQRRIRRAHSDLVAKARAIGPEVAKEMVLLTALFKVAARRDGREEAYEFLKDIFQRVAVHSMPAIYQIDELAQCEGDSFENFKEFNVAMFEAMDREGTWRSDAIVNDADRLRIKVTSCANVELFSALGCPELGKLGCDHDLAGYPVILDRVDAEFRRPCTLAKGDDFCDFNFYRKGTAPPTEHLNR
ncbi:MAG: NAD(P)H-binding protein [Thermoanaerobaculia bacterium]